MLCSPWGRGGGGAVTDGRGCAAAEVPAWAAVATLEALPRGAAAPAGRDLGCSRKA